VRREAATVVRVVHGDTVKVRVGGRVETVRPIGLDTPESVDSRRPSHCFGREASARARQLLLPAPKVLLEADPSQGERDRYGRVLRYIWLPDGRNFALVMVSEGYGFEFTYRFPCRYQAEFKAAEREAREQQRGLWAPGACP
jgi:micrococcal nuclease